MSDRTYYSQEAKAKAQRQTMLAVAKALVAGLVLGALGGTFVNPKRIAKTGKQLAHTVDAKASHLEKDTRGMRKMFKKRSKKYTNKWLISI